MKNSLESKTKYFGASIWKKRILFILFGGMGGYIYYIFIGCASGACPMTSNPWISTLYGSMIGLVATPSKKQLTSQ